MSKKHTLYDYERGLLFDHITDRTGLNNLNIIDSKYLVSQNILKYNGDFPYLISNIRARKTAELIKKTDINYFKEADNLLRDLGILQSKQYGLDTYYGTLIRYSWFKGAAESGTGYTPIYYQLNQLKSKISDKKECLQYIYRRLNFLELTFDELYYLFEKFDYDRIRILLEWTTNKFEIFTTITTEMILIIIGFFYEVNPKFKTLDEKDLYFDNMYYLLNQSNQFFNSINDAIYCLTLVELRNKIVHKSGHSLKRKNGKIFIGFEIDLRGRIKKYKILQDWLSRDVIPMYRIKKKQIKRYNLPDPFFNFVTWNLRMQKNGTFNTDDPIIKFDIELREFVDLMNKSLIYNVCNRLFRNLLQEL